jgi:hypothetical protein
MAIESVDHLIKEVDKGINVAVTDDIFDCINSTIEERRAWDAATCMQWSFELSKYQIFLHNSINRLITRIHFFENKRDYLHGKYAYDYGGEYCKIEQRIKMLSANNDLCREYDENILTHESEIRELKGLAYQINGLIDSLKLLAKTKDRNESNRYD